MRGSQRVLAKAIRMLAPILYPKGLETDPVSRLSNVQCEDGLTGINYMHDIDLRQILLTRLIGQ